MLEASHGQPVRVALFGASQLGRQILSMVRALPWCEVTAFFDNDAAKHGGTLDGVAILAPTPTNLLNAGVVLVSSAYRREIVGQLKEIGLIERVVLSVGELTWRFGPKPAGPEELVPTGRWRAAADALGGAPVVSQPSTPLRASDWSGFTIATGSFLPRAQALARSFLRWHRDARFTIFLLDESSGSARMIEPSEEGLAVVAVDSLGLTGFGMLTARYNAFELCGALRAALALWLMRQGSARLWVYLDADTWVTNPLTEVADRFAEDGLMLTPHRFSPVASADAEVMFLKCGTYNSGFFAFSDGCRTRRFLEWWWTRLQTHCVDAPGESLFVDQKWLDLAPSYHAGAEILRDPGNNVAYWNLDERTLTRTPTGFAVNGRPLCFFHFSGYDPGNPLQLTRHVPSGTVDRGPVSELLAAYASAVSEGDDRPRKRESSFNHWNGHRIPDWWRVLWRESGMPGVAQARSSTECLSVLVDWMRRPARPGSPFPRAVEIAAQQKLGLSPPEASGWMDFYLQVRTAENLDDVDRWMVDEVDFLHLTEAFSHI